MPRSMDEHPSVTYCESHHWISTNVPGLLTRWIIQCSLCGAYNVQEMNNTLYELVAEALENAADDLPYLDRPSNMLVRQQDAAYWLRDLAVGVRGEMQ